MNAALLTAFACSLVLSFQASPILTTAEIDAAAAHSGTLHRVKRYGGWGGGYPFYGGGFPGRFGGYPGGFGGGYPGGYGGFGGYPGGGFGGYPGGGYGSSYGSSFGLSSSFNLNAYNNGYSALGFGKR